MNRDSNAYTFLFAAAMVLVVASSLAFTATSLKDQQNENVRKEKFAENKSEPLEENLKNGDQNPDKDAENLNNEEKNNFKNTKSQPEVN